jgi:hypothetical protein
MSNLTATAVIKIIKATIIDVFIVVLTWIVFYQMSLWLFAYFEYNPRVYWVFLPAGIRMIAVFIFGWAGVLGLFIGSVITNEAQISSYVIYLSTISAISPMVAKRACKWWFNIPVTLQGLTGKQLLAFAVIGALTNALLSNLYFYFATETNSLKGIIPMFVGDLLGTLIIFYLMLKILQLIFLIHKKITSPIL